MVRKLLKLIIPNNWISTRKIFNRKIVFFSKSHLNLFFFKSYEPKIWKQLKEKINLDESSKIIDIGANIGQAMLGLNNIFPNNVIDCYEPQANEFCFLELNRLINKVPGKSHNYAIVANSIGEVNFNIDYETGGRSSFISGDENSSTIKVKSKPFSALLNENIGLIKIDIEGFESDLFDRSFDQLRKVYLIIEVRESTSEHIISYFIDSHFIYHLEENREISEVEKIKFCNLLISPKKNKLNE